MFYNNELHDYDKELLEGAINNAADNTINCASIMYQHMIKYSLQPDKQSASWVGSIVNNSEKINSNLSKTKVRDLLETEEYRKKLNKAFENALNKASDESHLNRDWLDKKSENIRIFSPTDLGDRDKIIKFLNNYYSLKSNDHVKTKNKINEFINGE